jgi:hypothetical protein
VLGAPQGIAALNGMNINDHDSMATVHWLCYHSLVRGASSFGGAMSTQTTGSKPLNIVAMGWAFSAALIVLFVICMISSFILPNLPASQGWAAWLALFSVTQTDHPFLAPRIWIDGILFSLFFGWITAVVLGLVYNRLISR